MADMDKAKDKAEEIEGRAKQGVGSATGDESTRREGSVDEVKGDVKQAGEKVKDALRRD
ncbi:MAG: CsbD family protein [Acidobacteriota bacterium]|nr:CsbD family protein [Acidobacteriota bacterium]